jgi:beta-ribofuranosylaminobenzene 5'-phosphate synthase
MSVRVTTGARLHFGFRNLSTARNRLYGGIGAAVDRPRIVLSAERAPEVRCDANVAPAVARAVELLDVPGAAVTVAEWLPRHVGLGSGTQLALAAYVAVARAHDRAVDVRAVAPELGRAGRSGVGVAGFEQGGFVVDEGHPAERFTADRPARGDWSVPEVAVRHSLPPDWRFVLVLPDCPRGRSGDDEDASMRSVIERADPAVADEVERVLDRRLVPAVLAGNREAFGDAVAAIDRLNGRWYADEQGGVYRPPVGAIVEALTDCPAVSGAGQTSWGPAVYGVTDADVEDEAREGGRAALDAAGVDGDVLVVRPRNEGAWVEDV